MNVTDKLTALAESSPDGASILTVDGILSFAELDRAVSATAKAFQDAGIHQGDIVGMALPDQLEQLVASLGLARLGAGQFVFHGSDTPELRESLARRVPIAATVTHDAVKTVAGAPAIAPPPGTVSELAELPEVTLVPSGDPDLTVFCLRSSGTTGQPRIFRLTQAMMPARMRPLEADGQGGRLLSLTHMDFEGAKRAVYSFLLGGGCVAFFNDVSIRATVDFVLRNNIDFISGSPIHAATLLESYQGATPLFPGVNAFRLSSTLVPESLRRDIMARLTPNLYVSYGVTEIGVIAIAPPKTMLERPEIVGWIGQDIEAEIVDESGHKQAAGTPGQLRVRSSGMVAGYVGDPEETAKRFRDGWFYTGDRCVFADDGALFHFGRIDDLIIFDGINIYPSAIESVLLAEPSVAAVAAFGIDSRDHGSIPVAAVVLAGETTREELLARAKAKLGMHAPLDIMIVGEFPTTTAGKVIKRELADAWRAANGQGR